jgi:Flp pilus assembly protein TadG
MSAVFRHVSNFVRDEAGSATIESLLWIPLLFTVMLLGLQVSLVSTKQAMVMRIIQDGNRAYALGRFSSPGATTEQVQIAVATAVKTAVAQISPNAKVAATIDNAGTILTGVQMPVSDLSGFRILPGSGSLTFTIQVAAQQTKEF